MDFEPKPNQPLESNVLEFADPPESDTLEFLEKDKLELVLEPATSEELQQPVELLEPATSEELQEPVELLEPIEIKLSSSTSISQKIQHNWQTTQLFLSQIKQIDRRTIDDIEMQPARIKIGLTFVGFGALGMVLLLLHISSIHPNYNFAEKLESYWYQYIWFVCLGVAGLFMLGRESLRPVHQKNLIHEPIKSRQE